MKEKLSPEEKNFIKELADTNSVQKLAEELLDKMKTDDMALLIANFILMKLKGAKYNEILYQYIIQHFFNLLRKLLVTLPILIPKILTDFEFLDMMMNIPEKEVNLREFFEID